MKIYTKRGDGGTTSLIGGRRVAKDDLRVEAYGTVDELGAHLALLRDSAAGYPDMEALCEELAKISSRLMTVAAQLALDRDAPEDVKAKMPAVEPAWIASLEGRIDEMDAALPAVRMFTIPGGHPLVSQCHVCRTVCRRAERACVRASHEYGVDAGPLACLNRLSDYLYMLGRTLAMRLQVPEKCWEPGE